MKIAILSDSPMIPTGFRNQSLQLAQYLVSKGHEVHYMGNAFMGMTLNNFELYDGTKCNFKLYGEMQHSYFRNSMSEILKSNMIDRFIILLDTFMVFPWFLDIDTSPAKTYFWFPTDGGGGLPNGCHNILKKVNVPVAMSEFGKKQLKEYHNIESECIPHGVNTDLFYKMSDEERNKLRSSYGLQDKFVIGVIARNQPRKHLDRTLKAMCLIKEKIPNAILFLHLDPDDPAQPLWRMRSLIQKFGLENRVVFSGMKAHQGIPEKDMKNMYNIMDCFFLSTSGEGFGIPIIEAMACEVPVVATSYTTTPELVELNKAGFGIKLAGVEQLNLFELTSKEYDYKSMNGTITGSWEVERGICDIKDATNCIEKLYINPELRMEMGKNGRKVVMEKYDFNIIALKWEKLIKGE